MESLGAYGRLYNWYAVDDSREICPSGWHVPTDSEWVEVELVWGMSIDDANSIGWRGTDEGSEAKTTFGWYNNGNGSNLQGFAVPPGGYRFDDGSFYSAGSNGYLWSSSPVGGESWFRGFSYLYDSIERHKLSQRLGFSVRCIKDSE